MKTKRAESIYDNMELLTMQSFSKNFCKRLRFLYNGQIKKLDWKLFSYLDLRSAKSCAVLIRCYCCFMSESIRQEAGMDGYLPLFALVWWNVKEGACARLTFNLIS